MNRRDFLAGAAGTLLAATALADEAPADARITRVVGFTLPSKRSKLAGKNARLDVHGDRATDRMLRVYTNAGVEGIGNCGATQEAAAQLLGRNPFDFFDREARRMNGPLGAGMMPLWDLVGKLLKKPVYELLGGQGTQPVPVYDGSIYFADLLPQYAEGWQDRFRQEIDQGLALGHRAFKIKVGRGFKWMSRSQGDQRDVEVVKLIREHTGPDVLLAVDANNGYSLASAKKFLEQVGDVKLAFVEELFPETVDECRALQQFFLQREARTLVADGETQSDLEAFKPFITGRALDILQGDMNRFGIDGIMNEAAMAKEQMLRVAPHNWGSLVGFYMQLHIGRAVSNFYRAEHDPLSNEVLVAEGYAIRDGAVTVPDAPGFGLAVNEAAFAGLELAFDEKG